jgi:hypothetical protein
MADEEEEKKELSRGEIRRTISTALAAAFGFVIALIWKEVVLGGVAVAGIDLSTAGTLTGWAVFAAVAGVLTVMMVVLIIVISRWGSKAEAGA